VNDIRGLLNVGEFLLRELIKLTLSLYSIDSVSPFLRLPSSPRETEIEQDDEDHRQIDPPINGILLVKRGEWISLIQMVPWGIGLVDAKSRGDWFKELGADRKGQ